MIFYLNTSPVSKVSEWPVSIQLLVTFGIPLAFAGGFWLYQFINRSRWEKGIFPQRTAYSRDSMLEVYICLAARLIRADRNDAKEKIRFLHDYFDRYFPEVKYNFNDSLRFSMNHPIQIESISLWLGKHLSYKERVQIMYFLIGLSYIDGLLNKHERKILEELRERLIIHPKEYESIIAIHEQRQEKRRAKERAKQQRSSEPSAYRKQTRLQRCYKILGVAESADMEEIKKAYRSQVKLHHPDRFANESEEQQAIAHERFIELQEAYEYIEKYK